MNNKRIFVFVSGIIITSGLAACGGQSDSNPVNEPNPALPSFFVGNNANTRHIREDFSVYWNQLTPEFQGFWGQVENIRGQNDWQYLDTLYQFAEQHNLPVKAHALISQDFAPAWLSSLPPALFAEEMETWIQDYCARYPNTPMINVVYNAMPGHSSTAVFAKALGEDWVVQSFKWAREHCPNSVLILDDYALLSTDTDAFIDWAAPVILSGFVDAIGTQAQSLENVDTSVIAANLDKLATLGLPIYISQWEIAEEDDAQQLTIMQQQLPIFYNHPSVAGITYWGYVENQQFTQNVYLLNEDDSPRPALTWLQTYLEDHPRE